MQSEFDEQARLTNPILWKSSTVVNQHAYQLNAANQRTRQTFTGGNYVDYTYDNIGQLKTAKGWEANTTTARLQEQFGYAYDAAWNLQNRTNNALVQTFGVNHRNELTNATRSGSLAVAGLASQPGANLDHVVACPVRYLANGAAKVGTRRISPGEGATVASYLTG